MTPHTQSVESVLETLKVDPAQGLSKSAVEDLREQHGINALVDKGGTSPWKILAEQFTSLLVILLIVASFVSGVILKEWIDAAVILLIVILNGVLGFRQEYKAERAMAALKKMTVPLVRVLRNGQEQQVKSEQLVPGDIVKLEAGNLVSADCRLLKTSDLRVQEASLTGESVPVSKGVEILADPETPLGDRTNMTYMGTTITYGRGEAVITDTGMKTELGKIAHRLQSVVREETPLQKQLHRLGIFLVVAALLLISIVIVIGFFRGEPWQTLFLTAVSMAVAAVPEGLPAVVTIALALGAQRMLTRKALIRKLPAVETLGSVTTICSDKTGTLTQNRMAVTNLATYDSQTELSEAAEKSGLDRELSDEFLPLLAASSLCSDAVIMATQSPATEPNPVPELLGDPTEGALVFAALIHGLDKALLEKQLPRISEAPFDSDRKRMTTVHAWPENPDQLPDAVRPLAFSDQTHFVSFTKGASDSVLAVCNQVWSQGRAIPMTEDIKSKLQKSNDAWASQGIRVLALGFCPLSTCPQGAEAMEKDLVFLGLVGMVDPIRPEAINAVKSCVKAGIRVIMITGDHPLMARYIARQLDIFGVGDKPHEPTGEEPCITGRDLDHMTDEELEARLVQARVFARVVPEHKLRIVKALQKQGHICAMTGDGVNDAPALKASNIGVAMGITGTDVSKEASDMVLQNDNFATIVAAVEEGRTIFGNIRRFIRFLLSCNTGELWIFLLAPILGMPLPLLPVQILWMNLVTDGFPALGLGVEPPEKDIMDRPPRAPKSSILGWKQVVHIIWVGALIALASIAISHHYWANSPSPTMVTTMETTPSHEGTGSTWQTLLFTTMVFAQLFLALAERSDRQSFLKIGLFTNPYLLIAVTLSIMLQLLVVYLPWANHIFHTVPLTLPQLGLAAGCGLCIFLVVELKKLMARLTHQPLQA